MNSLLFPIYKTNKDNSARFCLGIEGNKTLIYCGLNPSTATKEKSDPTISKVQAFTKKFGYNSFIMINLYPLRSTDPSGLPIKSDKKLHSENLAAIGNRLTMFREECDFVACWGNKIESREYLYHCLNDIWIKNNRFFRNIYRLGDLTILSHPKHPGRIGYENKLEKFNVEKYLENVLY